MSAKLPAAKTQPLASLLREPGLCVLAFDREPFAVDLYLLPAQPLLEQAHALSIRYFPQLILFEAGEIQALAQVPHYKYTDVVCHLRPLQLGIGCRLELHGMLFSPGLEVFFGHDRCVFAAFRVVGAHFLKLDPLATVDRKLEDWGEFVLILVFRV
jgi:hypothetical protein